MKKKIMIVMPSLKGGGAERVTINVANNLNKDKFEIIIVSCTRGNDYKDYIDKHIDVVELNKSSVKYAVFSIKRQIEKYKPDIILSVMEHTYMSTILAKKVSRHTCKVILVVHSTYSNSLKYSNIKSKATIFDKISKVLKIYKHCDNIIFVSKESYKDFSSRFKLNERQARVIYNPIIFDNIDFLKNEYINQDSRYRNILAVGRLTKAKDYNNLIQAIDYIVNYKKIEDIRLTIVGKGELEDNLKEIVKNKRLEKYITFWGFEKNPFKLMSKCDVFVLSSLFEGLPTVLVEAMYCGSVVISTDCKSGPNEIITDGVDGYLVPVSNSTVLGEKIIDILDDKYKQNDYIRRNAVIRAKDFHVDKCIKEYEQLFEELV